MIGYIVSLTIALLLCYYRKKINTLKFLLVTLSFFILMCFVIKANHGFSSPDLLKYKPIAMFVMIVYGVSFLNFMYLLITRLIVKRLRGFHKDKIKPIVWEIYDKFYLLSYWLGNLLINYGIWLK